MTLTLDELLAAKGLRATTLGGVIGHDFVIHDEVGERLVEAISRIHSLQSERDSHQRRVKELTRERDASEATIGTMAAKHRNRMELHQQQYNGLMSKCDNLDAAYKRVQSENSALKAKVEELEEAYSGCREHWHHVNKKLTEAEAAIAGTSEQRRFEAACAALTGYRAAESGLDCEQCAMTHEVAAWCVGDADALMAELAQHPEKLVELLDRIENEEVAEWEPSPQADKPTFEEHLERATETVASWPQWKREALGKEQPDSLHPPPSPTPAKDTVSVNLGYETGDDGDLRIVQNPATPAKEEWRIEVLNSHSRAVAFYEGNVYRFTAYIDKDIAERIVRLLNQSER